MRMSIKQHELIRTLREDRQQFQGQWNNCLIPVFVGDQNFCRIHKPDSQPSIMDGLDSARELDDV